MTMRNPRVGAVAGLAGVLVLAALAAAQNTAPNTAQNNAPRSPWKYYPADRATGDGGPAPKRDLSGTWAGPASGSGAPRQKGEVVPPLTDLGKQLFARNKPLGKYSPGGTNDPHSRYCDPFGFPQNMTQEIRGMTIATTPTRTFLLLQYMDLWREIWTDGRALPAVVGGRSKDAHDPKYNGYSIGRWEDDYTFVVETTGLAPETWATKSGYPHTVEARVVERFHRSTHNDLSLNLTMTDPKLYTQPFFLGEVYFRWIPNQQVDDFTCIPSEQQLYLKEMGDPAGSDPDAATQGGRGGRP
jgi:hypothetical protein